MSRLAIDTSNLCSSVKCLCTNQSENCPEYPKLEADPLSSSAKYFLCTSEHVCVCELSYCIYFPGSFLRRVFPDAFPCKALQSRRYLTMISLKTAYCSIQVLPAVILISSKITFYSFCPSQHRRGN